jgi:hypothetical protein
MKTVYARERKKASLDVTIFGSVKPFETIRLFAIRPEKPYNGPQWFGLQPEAVASAAQAREILSCGVSSQRANLSARPDAGGHCFFLSFALCPDSSQENFQMNSTKIINQVRAVADAIGCPEWTTPEGCDRKNRNSAAECFCATAAAKVVEIERSLTPA